MPPIPPRWLSHGQPASAILTAPSAITRESLMLMCGQRSAAAASTEQGKGGREDMREKWRGPG